MIGYIQLQHKQKLKFKENPHAKRLVKTCPNFLKLYEEVKERLEKTKLDILKGILKGDNHEKIIHIFSNLIPNEMFGNSKNRKIFLRLVNIVITQAQYECISIDKIVPKFNMDKISWLSSSAVTGIEEKRFHLQQALIVLMNTIVIHLHEWMFKKILWGRTYEYKFVTPRVWNLFVTKVVGFLIKQKYLLKVVVPVEPSHVIGSLRIKPKGDNIFLKKTGKSDTDINQKDPVDFDAFRPLVRAKQSKLKKYRTKTINQNVGRCARNGTFVRTVTFYDKWSTYLKQYPNDQQLYGLKLDISDCYGNVNLETLSEYVKIIPDPTIQRDVLKLINNQYVEFGYTTKNKRKIPVLWKWNHGLIQGSRCSASLSEFYMSLTENKLLKDDFDKPNCFIYRIVDDYLFVSTDKEDCDKFLYKMKCNFEVKSSKTQRWDTANGVINYCGWKINLFTKQIENDYQIEPQAEFHKRFKFWNYKQRVEISILVKRLMQYSSNNFFFSKVYLNLEFNTETTVLNNYFHGMLIVAFKFDAFVMTAYLRTPPQEKSKEIIDILNGSIHCYACKAAKRLGLPLEDRDRMMHMFVTLGKCAFLAMIKGHENLLYKEIRKTFEKDCNSMRKFTNLPEKFKDISRRRVARFIMI